MYDVIFLDMDNTIAENKTCRDVDFNDGLYEHKRPIKFVMDAVNALLRPLGKKVVLVTVCQGGDLGKQEKLLWLSKVGFEYDDILFIDETEKTKTNAMIKYCETNGYFVNKSVFIDDKKSMLQDAEINGFHVMYPQQLLVDYYNYLQT